MILIVIDLRTAATGAQGSSVYCHLHDADCLLVWVQNTTLAVRRLHEFVLLNREVRLLSLLHLLKHQLLLLMSSFSVELQVFFWGHFYVRISFEDLCVVAPDWLVRYWRVSLLDQLRFFAYFDNGTLGSGLELKD